MNRSDSRLQMNWIYDCKSAGSQYYCIQYAKPMVVFLIWPSGTCFLTLTVSKWVCCPPIFRNLDFCWINASVIFDFFFHCFVFFGSEKMCSCFSNEMCYTNTTVNGFGGNAEKFCRPQMKVSYGKNNSHICYFHLNLWNVCCWQLTLCSVSKTNLIENVCHKTTVTIGNTFSCITVLFFFFHVTWEGRELPFH